ncbi:hypothetical protein HRF14_10815 [Enterococcus faecalis]|uniref:hypothetical protein n=1 Tax=Enterococcus faecalis TaxID=1351 RepID=UPI000CF29714|nr:hypothetical protein [Enterococcus faecalis]EKQ3607624.1 hypothetical protein [Enterococcus faecalis]MBE9443409.1 hypothetical protein [Enterococcus faecalis]MBE9446411.1 hypothetical protein [Enterococcus faecalis]MBE9452001.1 hypothetical protein [Enterococcus faecalis]NSQ22640.1 hypothetical protein [Enterococcus faecalis]
MRKTIERPKEAITKVKTGKLDMKDVFIIFAVWGFGYLTKVFVAPIIEIGYVIAYPISMYLLLSPSNVPAKKNIQVVIQLFLKDKTTYHSILPQKEQEHEI